MNSEPPCVRSISSGEKPMRSRLRDSLSSDFLSLKLILPWRLSFGCTLPRGTRQPVEVSNNSSHGRTGSVVTTGQDRISPVHTPTWLGGLSALFPRIRTVIAMPATKAARLARTLKQHQGWQLRIVRRRQRAFKITGLTWVVERSFAWLEPPTEQGLRVSGANLRDDDRPCRNPPYAKRPSLRLFKQPLRRAETLCRQNIRIKSLRRVLEKVVRASPCLQGGLQRRSNILFRCLQQRVRGDCGAVGFGGETVEVTDFLRDSVHVAARATTSEHVAKT
jgi:hypothetical protein